MAAVCAAGAACGARTSSPALPDSPTPPASPVEADWKIRGAILGTGGMIDAGELTVKGDTITCVAASCPTTTTVPVYDAGGAIFPGLVDIHNHTAYDFLPQWTPPHLYTNRSQWEGDSAYAAAKQPYTDNQSALICEMTKYAEVGSFSSGVTTTEGGPNRKCTDTLARNIDNYSDLGVGGNWVRTNILGISTVSTSEALSLTAQMDDGTTRAYLLHLAEGLDAGSKAEFGKMVSRGLLRKETVIVHGTALGATEFAQMAGAGMNLVWSPSSNLALYGATTDIAAARAAGVKVSLAPDWTLTGSPSLLQELHVAATWSDANGGILSDAEIVSMATEHPAAAVDFADVIGGLAAGRKADLFVMKGHTGEDPIHALAREATRKDIAFVVVGGQPLYGTPSLMTDFTTALSEPVDVCGEPRMLTLAKPETDNLLGETWSQVKSAIVAADPSAIDPLACQ